ncbi:MAG: hypothetical protein NT080_13980 [Spirochaetes bacterium]|nr:hypothetical protein [Spirochaetota bacterium]
MTPGIPSTTVVSVGGDTLVSLFLLLAKSECSLDSNLVVLSGKIRAALYATLTIEEMERIEFLGSPAPNDG